MMKKYPLILSMLLVALCGSVQAQNVTIGTRMGELKAREWPNGRPESGKPQLVSFFHSSSPSSILQLAQLDKLAADGSINVVVVVKEPLESIKRYILPSAKYYIAQDDDGRIFSSYDIDFVPFSILSDAKGRIAWFGANPSQKIITDNLK